MKVYNVDYGCYLIENKGKIYLFDVGTEERGRNSIVPFIYRYFPNKSKIEAIFISHWHSNHSGGFSNIAENFEIGHFYSNGTYSTGTGNGYGNDPHYQDLAKTIVSEKNIPYTYLKQGNTFSDNELDFIVWSPLEKYFTDGGETDDPNGETGMVLQVKYGDFSIVFGGDIWNPTILEEVWDKVGDVSTNIFAWPHHGDTRTRIDSIINPMGLDLAMVERLSTSYKTIDWLKDKGIDYCWLFEGTHSGVEAFTDGGFNVIENDTKEYNKPKGKTFMF